MGHEEARERRPRGRWTPLLGLMAALPLVTLVWLTMPRSFRGEALPDPNGYDDLIAASRAVRGEMVKVSDLKTADTEELRTLVEANRGHEPAAISASPAVTMIPV